MVGYRYTRKHDAGIGLHRGHRKRLGLKVACIEVIAYNIRYIDRNQVLKLAEPLEKNDYGRYLIDLVNRTKE